MSEQVVCVDPAKIDKIWPHVADFIQSAFLTGIGDDTAEVIKADLDSGASLLWIVWDGKGIIAAATTKLMQVPTKKLCVVTSCGGRELPRWVGCIAHLEQYARDEGCDAIRVMGRHGWKAHFKDYHEPWVCLEKGLR